MQQKDMEKLIGIIGLSMLNWFDYEIIRLLCTGECDYVEILWGKLKQ